DKELCLFNNIPVTPNQITFIAQKSLDGISLGQNADGQFTFTLTENGKVLESKSNDDGGLVTFAARKYTKEDAGKTFVYEIKEQHDNKYPALDYSKTSYKATVEVTLDAAGKIQIEVKELLKDGTKMSVNNAAAGASTNAVVIDGLEFVNPPISETKVHFSGEKHLVGFENVTLIETFKFSLTKVGDTAPAETVEVTPKSATDVPKIDFKEITYTYADYKASENNDHTIDYVIREVAPTLNARTGGVTYSEQVYNAHVKLYYDANYQLQAKKWTDENVDPEGGLLFTNVFAGENEVVFEGIKEIKGKELVNGAYTFTLTGDGQDQTVKNTGNAITFKAIKYDQTSAGTHEYLIKETAAADGSTIDEHVYKAIVTIDAKIGADGKLVKDVKYIRMLPDPQKPGEYIEDPLAIPSTMAPAYEGKFVFENEYKASNFIDIEGEKHMKRKPLRSGDYWFVLKEWDDEGKNPEVLKKVTHGNASIEKTTREAFSRFEFSHLEKDENGNANPNYVKEFNFTQEDLRTPDGKGYLDEVTKHYTVEELIEEEKNGVTSHGEVYFIEVTIKRDGTDKLVVEKSVFGKDGVKIEGNANSIPEFVQNLIGKMKGQDSKIVFRNDYYSECPIDPPVLTKEIMGRKILPGEFAFEVKGTPFLKMPKPGSEYVDVVYNDEKGEIDVSNIHLTIDDLDLQSDGSFSKEFVYTATEIDPKQPGMIKSPAMYELRFIAYDDGNGKMYTVPPEKAPEGKPKLEWKQISPNGLEREADFVNIFNWNGSVDIHGLKKMDGRKLKDDDVFRFTIKEVGENAPAENTYTVENKREKVDFLANTVVGTDGRHFLQYKYGAFEETEGVLTPYDDRGDHVYEIVEEAFTKEGVSRDPSIFRVHVTVAEVYDEFGKPVMEKGSDGKPHGKLSATITEVEQIKNKISYPYPYDSAIQFEFTNEFRATGSVDLNGIKFLKELDGKDYKSEKSLLGQFIFALHQYSNEERTLGKELIDSKNSSATDGSFAFDTLKFDQEVLKNKKDEYDTTKTLYYRVTEVKPSGGKWNEDKTQFESEGIVFDLVEYDVDVVITLDEGSTQLKVEKVIKNAANKAVVAPTSKDGKSYDVSFTNKVMEYKIIEGTKYWVDNIKDPNDRPDLKITLYSRTASNVVTKVNEYTLKAPNTEYVFMTDSKGNKLPTYDSAGRPITYEVEEEPIEGYLSEKVNYDFYNTKGDVLIRKIDADTRATLAGATLAILDGSTEIERWVSGASAHVVAAALTAGKSYTLREIEAPAGYGKAPDMTFTVPSDGKEITVTMSDPKILGSVRLTKRDASTRETLAGAEFALYSEAGTRIYATGTAGSYRATDSTSNGVFITDSTGTLTISDLPYGTYYFRETKAPAGYALTSDRLGFSITSSGALVEVTALDPKSVGSVRLIKVGESGTRTLSGAVFELYAATPRSIGQAATSTIFSDAYYRYGTYRTNANGEIYVDGLPWDSYYFVEVDAPAGYEVARDVNGDDIVYTFTIDERNADATIELGRIINNPTPPPPPGPTPTPTPGVLGERVRKGGVVSGVLGVRAKPTSGVLGERIGPVTGDASNIILWLLLLSACVATIVATIVTGKKKKTAGAAAK
nr:Cna B-type domain-containing protein [Lachnospiraceae bacterium]